MKSFLLYKSKPVINWGSLPDNTFYQGKLPGKDYALAVCPGKYVVIDVDMKNGKQGFNHIPKFVLNELEKTFNYPTKNGGKHYWLLYKGNKTLLNRASEFGIDLRVGERKNNSGGYVKYHHNVDIRECTHLIKPTSKTMNKWIEKLFS